MNEHRKNNWMARRWDSGWVDGWLHGCLHVYVWTGGQPAPTATAYLLLLSTGATDLLMYLLQEPLSLLTGLLQFSLLLPQQSVLQSQHMYFFLQLSPIS